MIQQALLEQIATFALSRITRAEYVAEGVAVPADFHTKAVAGTKVTLWVTIPAGVPEITEIKIYDADDTLVIWELDTRELTDSRVTYVRIEIDTKELLA